MRFLPSMVNLLIAASSLAAVHRAAADVQYETITIGKRDPRFPAGQTPEQIGQSRHGPLISASGAVSWGTFMSVHFNGKTAVPIRDEKSAGLEIATQAGSAINSSGAVVFAADPIPHEKSTMGGWRRSVIGYYDGQIKVLAGKGNEFQLETGVLMHSPHGLVMNDAGQVAFEAKLMSGGDASGMQSFALAAPDTEPILIARSGRRAPLGPDVEPNVVFQVFEKCSINASGKVAFYARLSGAGKPMDADRGVFLYDGGINRSIARTYHAPPGLDLGNQVTLHSISFADINDAGDVAYVGHFGKGQVENRGIFVSRPVPAGGTTQPSGGPIASAYGQRITTMVAGSNSSGPGPDLGPGVVFHEFNPAKTFHGCIQPAINGAGDVAFCGTLKGTGVNESNDKGIFVASKGKITTIARSGAENADAILSAGVYFKSFVAPHIDASGNVAFRAELTGDGVTEANDYALLTTVVGKLVLIAREGDSFDGDSGPETDIRTINIIEFNDVRPSGGEDGQPSGFSRNGKLAFRLKFTDHSTGVFTAIATPTSQ